MTADLPSWLEKEKKHADIYGFSHTENCCDDLAFNEGLLLGWQKTQERIKLLKKKLHREVYPEEGVAGFEYQLFKRIDEVFK